MDNLLDTTKDKSEKVESSRQVNTNAHGRYGLNLGS